MVRINGNSFEIYILDTELTILNRIAGLLNTIRQYLYFPEGIPLLEDFNSDKNIIVEDVLKIIREYEGTFDKLYEDVKDRIVTSDIIKDIITPFIVYNNDINDKYILQALQYEINYKLDGNIQFDIFEEMFNTKNNIIKQIDEKIQANKIQNDENMELFLRLERTVPNEYSDFETLKDINILTLKTVNITISEIFNHIQLNMYVPFASFKNFYKIFKDFIPYEEWYKTENDSIVLMISPYIDILSTQKNNDYTRVIIKETLENEIKIYFYFNNSLNKLNKEKIIERIINIFSKVEDLEIKSHQIENINGVFYLPFTTINKYVFADLIMNNIIFSRLLSINESEKATKNKSSSYIYFNHVLSGSISATVTEQIMPNNVSSMKNGVQKYIRIKVKNARDMKSIEYFQIIFSKLFKIYLEEYDNIVNIYTRFIPDFLEETIEINVQPKTKQSIFPGNFRRNCSVIPTLIENSDQENYFLNTKKRRIVSFPSEKHQQELSTKYKINVSQEKYVCDNDRLPFVGLMENKHENKEYYPLLPCCYVNDPESEKIYKVHKKYREYYNMITDESPKDPIQKIQQNIIKTNKFVNFQIVGVLPKILNKLFNMTDIHTNNMKYNRIGMYNTKHSLINCILVAINNESIKFYKNQEEMDNYLSNLRKTELSSLELACSCKQEMYDYTITEIQETIKDTDAYFDPKLFIHLLEEKYDCNIILFSRDNNNTEMILPRHVQFYKRRNNNKPYIFIYEHWGSESDHAQYPRCELIIKTNDTEKIKDLLKDNITYMFEYNHPIYKNISTFYESFRKTYHLNKIIEDDIFPLVDDIVSQKIDSYGKVRMLNIKFGNNVVTVITPPMQPFAVPEMLDESISEISLEQTDVFFQDKKIERLTTEDDVFLEKVVIGFETKKIIHGMVGNVKISIVINDNDSSINNKSKLDIYNKNKKLARYITEYIFWIYSNFLKSRNITDGNILDIFYETIDNFIEENIMIIPEFEHGIISKTFSNENNGLMLNRKLILTSMEMLKRLVYVLRLELIRDPNKILDYYTRKDLNNFYIEITDFDQYHSQIILQGEESIRKWSYKDNTKYKLYNTIIEGNYPYFFKNELIDNNIYLAQNTDSIKKAKIISKIWYEEGYNPTNTVYVPEKDLSLGFTFFAYKSVNNIKRYSISGEQYEKNIKIIGYKTDENISKFTVLLELYK